MGEGERETVRVPDEQIMALVAGKAFGVAGVYGMGLNMQAAALRKNILGQDKKTKGVRVSYNEEAGYTIDIYLIAAFGSNIPETAWNVQKAVFEGLKQKFGIVTEDINIHIQGVQAD